MPLPLNELPPGWTTANLEELADLALGKMLDRAKRTAGMPLPYLRNLNVRWGEFRLDDLLEMPFEDGEFERYGIQSNDVLICEGGEPGRAAVWQDIGRRIMFQKAIHRVRPNGAMDPRWLVYHLRTDANAGLLEQHFTGTTIKHFTGSALRDYPVVLPPYSEQRRILAKLEALLARSRRAQDALEAIPALLERFRQSVLAAAFRGDLSADWRDRNPSAEPASELLTAILNERRRRWEDTELLRMRAKGKNPITNQWKERYEEPLGIHTASPIFDMPSSWVLASFDQITVESFYGPRFSKEAYTATGVPTVRTTDMDDSGRIIWAAPPCVTVDDAQFADFGLQHDDLLITRSGSIGRCALYDEVLGPAIPSAYLIRFRLTRDSLLPKYALYFLLSPTGQQLMGAGATSVTQSNINARTIREFPLPLPTRKEQAEIVRQIEAAFDRIRTLEESISIASESLAAINTALLAKAFRGDLVPQDPNDEPASVLLERIRAEREAAASTPKRGRTNKAAGSSKDTGDRA